MYFVPSEGKQDAENHILFEVSLFFEVSFYFFLFFFFGAVVATVILLKCFCCGFSAVL